MQMVNVTNEQSSETGSGLKNMVSRGLKALSRLIGGKKPDPVDKMWIAALSPNGVYEEGEGWYILKESGEPYAGPYAREKDAKGQLTRLCKGYTPAARKV
jgi:hypothetical protein